MENDSEKTLRKSDGKIPADVIPATVRGVSPTISAGKKDVISIIAADDGDGTIVLNGKSYKIVKEISASSGEAEVKVIGYEDRLYVFKHYFPGFKPNETVMDQLKEMVHKDIVALVDYGFCQGRFYELMEYAAGGSLVERDKEGKYRYLPIRDLGTIRKIVDETVNALDFCHKKDIIHRDIKPHNILYKNADGSDIVISDFGIAFALETGVSRRGMTSSQTELYAAPEQHRSVRGKSILGKEVDYYSLGISLLHIWMGEEPFSDLNIYETMHVKCEGLVKLPQDMPNALKTLISGLLTVEVSKRWGYDEVQRWLKGEVVPVYAKAAVERTYRDCKFPLQDGREAIAQNPKEVADLLSKHPEEGKKYLYRGKLQIWVAGYDQALAEKINSITEDEYPTDEDAGLIKAIYLIDRDRNFITNSKEIECSTTEEIGDAIEKEKSHYLAELTKDPNSPLHMYLEARGFSDIANTLRNHAKAYNQIKAFNLILLTFQKGFKKYGLSVDKPEDLLSAGKREKDFLVKDLKNSDSKLCLWLEKYTELKTSVEKYKRLGRFNNVTLTYALDKRVPFIFLEDKVYNAGEFCEIFEKYIESPIHREQLVNPKSTFVDEANFWLMNYAQSDYLSVVASYLSSWYDKKADICTVLIAYIHECNMDLSIYFLKIKPTVNKMKDSGKYDKSLDIKQRDYLLYRFSQNDLPKRYKDLSFVFNEYATDIKFLNAVLPIKAFTKTIQTNTNEAIVIAYDYLEKNALLLDQPVLKIFIEYIITQDVEYYWNTIRKMVSIKSLYPENWERSRILINLNNNDMPKSIQTLKSIFTVNINDRTFIEKVTTDAQTTGNLDKWLIKLNSSYSEFVKELLENNRNQIEQYSGEQFVNYAANADYNYFIDNFKFIITDEKYKNITSAQAKNNEKKKIIAKLEKDYMLYDNIVQRDEVLKKLSNYDRKNRLFERNKKERMLVDLITNGYKHQHSQKTAKIVSSQVMFRILGFLPLSYVIFLIISALRSC